MGRTGVEDSALRESAGEKLFFDSWESIENIFAGHVVVRLKEAGDRLCVVFTARDTWIKVTSPDPEKRDRAAQTGKTRAGTVKNTAARPGNVFGIRGDQITDCHFLPPL